MKLTEIETAKITTPEGVRFRVSGKDALGRVYTHRHDFMTCITAKGLVRRIAAAGAMIDPAVWHVHTPDDSAAAYLAAQGMQNDAGRNQVSTAGARAFTSPARHHAGHRRPDGAPHGNGPQREPMAKTGPAYGTTHNGVSGRVQASGLAGE